MKNKIGRLKFEYEDFPIVDTKKPINNADDFDEVMSAVKIKLFGRKK